ncbi:T9SS type A sorting domain-containing protein [Flavobacterium sp. WC2430]|uniref:T9SS type A sorting domain-containing protein n=1 Tax=Flavobacterium sp. WC2430 TaxID=3234137 RepID=UPI003466723F
MKKNTISNFFDVLSNEVMSFFISKKTVSKLNFLKFKERRAIDFISDYWSYFWRQWFAMPLILVAILVTGYTTNAQSIKGVVPVQYPLLGDGIDGDGWAHEPTGTSSIYLNVGDLFDRKNYLSGKPIPGTNPQEYYPIDGTNHGILNLADGSLLYPGTIDPVPVTFFLKDPFQNDPTIFTSSNKINDNPNTYTWGPGSSPNKNEIQNCGAHFSYGKDGMDGGISTNGTSFSFPITGNSKDLWCLFAGDRQVTNGSSYIDFEFLQKRLTITGALPNPGVINPLINTAPITGGSGSFISEGTDGGRTLGDLLITIEFTQGGGDATVVIQKWSEKAGGGFEYVVVFDGVNYSVPGIKGNIFCTNNTSTTDVPFDVYGSGATGSYAPNQWAEGGINLTQVFKATSSECFTISTLFIRTRSSGNSSQSELKDFPGRPIQLDLDFTPKAFAGADFTKTCISNPDGKEIGETPQAGFTYSWSPAEGLSATNIANPIANPLVNTTYTVTKTKTGTSCSDTDEVIVTVNKPTVVAVAGDDFTKNCLINTSGGSIGEAAAAGFTYSWVSSPVGFTSTSANPMVNPSVTTTYTVTKTHTTSGCTDTDDVTVTVNKPDVTANAGADFTKNCLINVSGGSIGEVAVAGYTYSWVSSPVGFTSTSANPFVNPSVTTTYTVTKTHTLSGCTDTDDVTVTVNKPTVVAVAGADFTKNCLINVSGGLIGEAAAAGYTYSWVSSPVGFTSTSANPMVNPSVTTTYTVTKTHTTSGCTATDDVTVTVNKPDVTANAGADFTKNCLINVSGGSIGEVAVAGYTYSWVSSPVGFTSTSANPFVNPSVTTTYTVTKTHTLSGCTDTDDVTVTVNKPTVVAVAGADFTKNCLINVSGGLIGEAAAAGYTYSWVSSPVGFTSTSANPMVNPSVTTTYTVTKTHTTSGCTDTDDVTVTVNKPDVTANAGAEFTKNCLINVSGGSIGEVAVAGYTYSWVSSPVGFTSTSANPFVNPSVTTTYTVTKTQTLSGCTDTDDVTVTVNKPTVVAVAGADFTKNCLINVSGGLIGEAAVAGYTYSWVSSPVGFTSTSANPMVNPSVTTTYTVTKTHTTSGCTDTDDVTVTVNKPDVTANAGADFTKNCLINVSGGSIGEVAVAGYTYSWVSSPVGFTSTSANPFVNPSVTTTYTVTKTHTLSGCTDTDAVTVTVNKPTVVAVAGADFTKNCLINVSGGLIGEAAAAGYTYSWVSSPVGFTSTNANPMVNPSVTTTYTVTKTHTTSGCTDTDDVTVTVNNALPNANAGADAQILCGNTTVGLSGSSTTIGATFLWTASNGGHIVSGADTASPIVDADGTYTLTVTDPANGCTATDDALVTTQICVKAICTYTQGYYGNVGGKSCAEGISYSTKELIAKALTSYGGKMTIGTLGHSVYIMNNMTDINALISVMPGGGGSYVLSAGNYEINSLPSSYLKNGRINNTLLAQTIALGLNIGINSNLGNFTLQAGTLAVAVPQGGCGSEIAKERTCNLDGTVNNEYKYYTIPSNVVTALGGNPTVQGLFDLANQALGGGSTNGLSLSAIAGLEDLLNNAFDECRIFVGYNVAPLNCPVLSLTSKVTQTEVAGFTASPVPFKDQLTIKYGFDYQSDVKIEVFNTQGNLVYSKRDTNSFLNKNVVLDLNINKGQEQVFIVKLTTDRGSSSKKVMSSQ